MSTKEWLEKAASNQALLSGFVAEWHPARPASKDLFSDTFPITASGAEQACVAVRTSIQQSESQLAPPAERFITALKESDFDEVYSLLNSSWFGIPESTSCWSIRGFEEAVSLLEDPPDDHEPSEEEDDA